MTPRSAPRSILKIHRFEIGGTTAMNPKTCLITAALASICVLSASLSFADDIIQGKTDPAYPNLTLPSPPRPYPTFQPKSPAPARHLLVADVEGLTSDEKVLLSSLQGIVNRKQPRIYLIFGPQDRFWLDAMQDNGETGAPVPIADPLSLVSRFRNEIDGAVVPDPQVYVTPQLCVDIAGVDNLIVATPDLAKLLNVPVQIDLRGRFKDDADADHYARTVLMPRMNPYLAISIDSPFDTGAIDQIVAARGMSFWVTGPNEQNRPGANETAELSEVEAILAQMPLNAVVRGYWYSRGDGNGIDEGPGVSLASRFGKATVVSDYITNLSVLSGVSIPRLRQKPRPAAPQLDRTKVYIAVIVSDGDNLCTWQNVFQHYFQDPLHGTFPIAWGMGPSLIDVAPTIAKWYYDHAAPNDEFVCDVSGIGYIYPPDWATALRDRDGALKDFYKWTVAYMDRMDMNGIRIMGVQPTDIANVGALLPKTRFLVPDYGYAGEASLDEMSYSIPTGQSVFRAVTGGNPRSMAAELRSRVGNTRPAFVNAFVVNWGNNLSDIKAALDALGPDYVPVTPSQLDQLYRESKQTPPR
jgi:hypothetical protein